MTSSSVTNNNNGGGGGQANSTRNCSPDTDSAFCDNLSVLSSCSASSGEKKGGGGGGSSGHSSGGSNHAVDEDARIKAEKIKLAIEKIKEASVKKLFIKVEINRYFFTVSRILEYCIDASGVVFLALIFYILYVRKNQKRSIDYVVIVRTIVVVGFMWRLY
jgi:hypothetical protein